MVATEFVAQQFVCAEVFLQMLLSLVKTFEVAGEHVTLRTVHRACGTE